MVGEGGHRGGEGFDGGFKGVEVMINRGVGRSLEGECGDSGWWWWGKRV